MTVHYLRILMEVRDTPLAMMPGKIAAVLDFLKLKSSGVRFDAAEIAARIGTVEAAAGDRSLAKAPGSVAVLNCFGVIAQRMNMMDDVSGPGGTSTEQLGRRFAAAVNDPTIKAIVLNIDSPGGSVYGVDELAAQIRDARGKKPIVAQVNSLAASAAYYIASAADEIVVTPSGEVGSIGVYSMHQDISKMLEAEGVKPTFISAGKFKVEGNSFEPLGAEAAAAMQARVDQYYGAFVNAVAKGRGVAVADVRNGFGEGRVVGAKDAIKLKMADRIATLDETLARFGAVQKPGGASAEVAGPAIVGEAEPQAPLAEAQEPAEDPVTEDPERDTRERRNRRRAYA